MAELPKIVSERLRDQAVAGEHPDANLLSSFAEQGLTEQESAPVLDHLSRCAQCREIVALSTPEAEQEVQVAVALTSAVVQRSWWRSPIVHWSALAAAALVVLIAVGERMQIRERRSASAPAIRYEPPVPQSTPAPAVAPPSPPPSTASARSPAPATLEPKQPAKGMQTPKTPAPAQTFNGLNARNALSRGAIASADKMAASGGVVAGAVGTAPALPPPAALPMKPHENPEAGKSDEANRPSRQPRPPQPPRRSPWKPLRQRFLARRCRRFRAISHWPSPWWWALDGAYPAPARCSAPSMADGAGIRLRSPMALRSARFQLRATTYGSVGPEARFFTQRTVVSTGHRCAFRRTIAP